MKGLARRNTYGYVKYESPSTNQSEDKTKVKIFVDGQTDRGLTECYYRALATDRQTDGLTECYYRALAISWALITS
jgi:hypothetical protein